MNTSMKILAAILAIAALLLAGFAARLAMQPAAPAAAPVVAVATYPVVVTARAVPAGQTFTAADLRVEQLPVRPAGAYTEATGLVGQRPTLDLGVGVPVLQALTSSGLAQRVAPGERAVAVRVDETIGIGHRVRPGDRIDLFLVLKTDTREIGATQARLLLPALRVLGYGDASVDGPADGDAPARDGQARKDVARTAVLAVPLDQVNHLLLGASAGQLTMALRHPDDTGQPSPLFTTLPTALPLPPQARGTEVVAADRAAAGVRLDALAGRGAGAATTRTTAPGSTVRAGGTAQRPRPVAATPAERVEIIRPGGRDTVSF